MFGIGFTEFLLIFVIAILFLGPDKLPQAIIDIAKFIKGVKQTISETKHSFNEEMKLDELKEEALEYKRELDTMTDELKNFKNINFDEITTPTKELTPSVNQEEEKIVTTQVEEKNETITFKKPEKNKDKDNA